MGFLFQDRIVVVTGGGSGIGLSLCKAFDDEGSIVVVCDVNVKQANYVASELLKHPKRLRFGFGIDVTDTKQVKMMINSIVNKYYDGRRIDIYCSNAGIIYPPPLPSASEGLLTLHSNQQWNRIFQVNTLSHIIAVRGLLPHWLGNTAASSSSSSSPSSSTSSSSSSSSTTHQDDDNDPPIFIMTASAAGLLTQIGNISYGVSKAAAVSFAEHLAIEYGDRVRILCLCPQAVDTPFIDNLLHSSSTTNNNNKNNNRTKNSAQTDGILSPQDVAKCTLTKILQQQQQEEEDSSSIFIFPHPKVELYMKRRAMDHNRWIHGMRRFKEGLLQQQQQQGEQQGEQEKRTNHKRMIQQSKL